MSSNFARLCLAQIIVAVGLLFPAARTLPAADLPWPQFRGPSGNGHAVGAELPVHWGEHENVVWKTPLPGEGWSSPVVGDGIAWMTAGDDEGRSLRVLGVDLATGKLVKNVEAFHRNEPIPKNPKNSFASPTPLLDDRCVYVHFGTQGTAAIERASGDVLWRNQDLMLDHKEGPGSSPILWNDLIIVNCDGMDVQFVAAVDKATGRLRWKTNRTGKMHDNPDFRKAYCTPLVATVDGRDQLVSPGADRVIGYDPADGRELWRVEYKGFSIVPRPVLANGLLYVTTAFARPELWAIRTGAGGDATETHVAWKMKKLVPSSPSPLVVGDQLYLIGDKGILTCVNALDGTEAWSERIGGNFSASPIYAGGKLYFFSEEGLGYVVRPGKKYELVAENHLDGRILASPAAVGKSLIVRTDKALYRLEAK